MSRVSRAFTLVELLVVIGIIGVLIGLLIPSLSAARSSSKQMNCSANMRAVTQALIAYVQDFEFVPPLDYSAGMISNNYNEAGLAALTDSDNAEGGYLRAKACTWTTATNVAAMTSSNVLYCPAMLPELQTDATGQNVGSGGHLNLPTSPVDDNDPRSYQGIIHQQVIFSLANNGSHRGIQSWYGTSGATYDFWTGIWSQTPIHRIVGDNGPWQSTGVKYSAILNPTKLVFLKEGGSSNQNLNLSIYRISAPHGLPGNALRTNIAFYDGHVENFRRSDIYPAAGTFSVVGCQRTGLAWRMDQ